MSQSLLRLAVSRYATRVQLNLSSRYQNVKYSTQRNTPPNGNSARNDAKSPGNQGKEQPTNYHQAINQKTNEILQKYLKESPKFDKDRAKEFRAEITKEVGEIRKEWVKKTSEGNHPDVINVSNKRP